MFAFCVDDVRCAVRRGVYSVALRLVVFWVTGLVEVYWDVEEEVPGGTYQAVQRQVVFYVGVVAVFSRDFTVVKRRGRGDLFFFRFVGWTTSSVVYVWGNIVVEVCRLFVYADQGGPAFGREFGLLGEVERANVVPPVKACDVRRGRFL